MNSNSTTQIKNATNATAAPSASKPPFASPSQFPSLPPSTFPSASPSLFPSPSPSLSPSLSPTDKPVSSSTIFARSEGMTLQAIGFTLGGGLCVTLFATVAFGIAVLRRSTNIAPRCTARHPNTIYRSRKDIYDKSKKGKRKDNRQSLSKRNTRTGTAAKSQQPNAIDEINKTTNKSTRISSTPLKTARQATRKSTAIATKLVTGLDLDGLCAAEQKQHVEEEEEQRREFVNNAIGQPVYVGAGARRRESSQLPKTSEHPSGSRSEGRTNSDSYDEVMVRTNSGSRLSSGHGDMVVRTAHSNTSGSRIRSEHGMKVQGKLYDVDAGVAVDELGNEISATNNEQDHVNDGAIDLEIDNNEQYIHPQDRGNPFLGWIPWTLHLSYDRMLRGIPGTGTRDGGMGGKLLGVNLDAVVLFRFHDLCLRVTAMATFLCVCIILPINLSACGFDDEYCTQHANLTNYGRTTIANIIQTTNTTNVESQNFQFWTAFFWTHSSVSHLIRLYAISICTWLITYYTLKNIKREWRENLVLRRVYYLEADHYGNRQSELEKTIYNPHADDTDEESAASDNGGDDDDAMDIRTRRAINKGQNPNTKPKYKCRQPWIPHPEHRDTIPNIELYSVLVGGLPSLPTEVVNTEDIETAIGFSKRASIDWQLAVATTFFDHCVPNQPGFSSSVVAVTILPAAPELAKAWRKWYAAAAALRRLRFIRSIINEKRYYDIDEVGEGDEESAKNSTKEIVANDLHPEHTPTRDTPQSRPRVTFLDDETASNRFYDAEMKRQIFQYRQTYGPSEDVSDLDYRIFRSLNYGPEQQAVYSREMAQGAAACCPNGCCEGRVRRQPIDRLLEMEEATIERLENAQYQLQCAQMQAAVSIVDKGDTPHKKGKSFDETEMMLQNTESTMKNSPIRSTAQGVPTNYSPNCAGVELPTLDEIFSSSNDGIDSVDVQPKCQDIISSAGNQGGRLLSKSLSNDSNLSYRDKTLAVETSRSKDSDASSKVNNNSRQSSSALRTINEHASDPRNVSSPTPNFDIASPSSIFPNSLGGSILRMTSEGRFLFNTTITDNDDESLSTSALNATSFGMNATEQDMLSPTESSLRRRTLTGQSSKTVKSDAEQTKASNQWEQVKNILRKDDVEGQTESAKNKPEIETGVWTMPSFKSTASSLKRNIISHLKAIGRWTKVKTSDNILTKKLAKDSTYAVVTFSSRQAAVAARHCLADGRGVHRWLSLETVPVPPLADAAPFDLITCRGCCRPVTLNLNQNQLMIRRYIALASLVSIYIFYTIPITTAQKVVEPSNLQTTLPGFYNLFNNSSFLSADIVSGLISGLLYTTFFALCPVMFKMIANAGSQATSVQEAEKYALNYYWYFMLTTAFVFTYIADAAIDIWYHSNVEQSLSELVTNIANATPLRTSATWLNWIIVRTTMTLPLQYMLQINTFIFGCIGWKCCARCTMGGGPGGPIPYRIYIDGGVVFVCVIALAPQSPLVAPMALLYYVVCTPLWRRNCIFMYRPKFDSGGERWPFLSDVMITSLYMGQFLLTLQMALRDAFGPALFAGLPAIPTYLYRNYLHKRFKRAYQDAGLLQTSLLDGWDNTIPSSVEKREEFRKFLVDAHKAAYIPVCIAGGATNILTAEPAVVIPNENDDMIGYSDLTSSLKPELLINSPGSPYFGDQAPIFQPARGSQRESEDFTAATLQTNRGACMRRAMSFSTPRSSLAAQNYADSVGPGINTNGTETNKQNLFSQKWQRAQEEIESLSIQNEDPGCTQQ